MGVVFARPDDNDRILAIARNGERVLADEESADADSEAGASDASPETPEVSPEA
jgi:DNA gyrase subunit A